MQFRFDYGQGAPFAGYPVIKKSYTAVLAGDLEVVDIRPFIYMHIDVVPGVVQSLDESLEHGRLIMRQNAIRVSSHFTDSLTSNLVSLPEKQFGQYVALS